MSRVRGATLWVVALVTVITTLSLATVTVPAGAGANQVPLADLRLSGPTATLTFGLGKAEPACSKYSVAPRAAAVTFSFTEEQQGFAIFHIATPEGDLSGPVDVAPYGQIQMFGRLNVGDAGDILRLKGIESTFVGTLLISGGFGCTVTAYAKLQFAGTGITYKVQKPPTPDGGKVKAPTYDLTGHWKVTLRSCSGVVTHSILRVAVWSIDGQFRATELNTPNATTTTGSQDGASVTFSAYGTGTAVLNGTTLSIRIPLKCPNGQSGEYQMVDEEVYPSQ